ncbi:MAG: AHH domain-containing protein [Myxococcales bacterium]
MSESDKHVLFDESFHEKIDCGCVWRHAAGWGESPCHYAVNGFNISGSKDRMGMYNDPHHRKKAEALGSRFGKESKRVELAGAAKARKVLDTKSKDRKFKKHVLAESSRRGLALRPRPPQGQAAQGIRHAAAHVRHQRGEEARAWYPYHHNYHHMIAAGAFATYVIGDDSDGKRMKRIEIVIASGWNINKPANLVLLPQEVLVAQVVGLPAHCPWGARSHPAYSQSLEAWLKKARRRLNKAAGTGDCRDAKKVAPELDAICTRLLAQLREMRGKALTEDGVPKPS